MGQNASRGQPAQRPNPEDLSRELAQRFAERCFTPLELTHFKDVFRTLADQQNGIQYWKEETLCRFLSIPDVLEVGPVLYQMVTYLGAFPYPSMAPAILTREAMVKIVVIMTDRSGKVLQRGLKDRNKLLFRALAVFDRRNSSIPQSSEKPAEQPAPREKDIGEAWLPTPKSSATSFTIDEPGHDDDDDDDDELALAALDGLDEIAVFRTEPKEALHSEQARIPIDNWRKLLMLLIIVAPLGAQQSLSALAARVQPSRLESLRRVADCILWSFAPEQVPGIPYHAYHTIIRANLPFIFDGFNPLFEHFLFSKNLDLSKHLSSSAPTTPKAVSPPPPLDSPLPSESEILNLDVLSQLSFFIPGSELFHRLRPLYIGANAGFSINSISQKVLNWRAPTILLVAGTRLPAEPRDSRAKAFLESLPNKRLHDGPHGSEQTQRVVYGAYIHTPWRQTHREAIGDAATILFQLEPVHDVLRASTLNRDYLTFSASGIGLGVPPPPQSAARVSSGHAVHTLGGTVAPVPLGPVSLFLDGSLEFGVFNHDSTGGGAFTTSRAHPHRDWQDRFSIDSLEIWGCGGDEEAARQREAWKWEEREAAARRGITLGKDRESDYALLEMAGIVGGHGNSGGSMG